MKRGHWQSWGTAFAALCLFLFSFAALGQDTARVVHIDNEAWTSNVVIVATSDLAMRTSDCTSFGAYTLKLPYRGSELLDHFSDRLCSGRIGVAELPILSGSARVWTEATYRDALGNFNVVEIPSLPQALRPGEGRYEFAGIENGVDGKSTFFALFTKPGTATRVTLTVRDNENANPKTEMVDVDGFAFYELRTALRIGNVTMTNTPIVIGCHGCNLSAPVWAVAFVGQRAGGSPRAELPALVTP
jgi:hypothetical protein